jgi:peroxiredoxin Q/BCP
MITIGDKAPAFELENAGGARVALGDFRGRNVVLYFYPKDNTPGCTREACDFRDNFARLTAAGAVVLGVSADSTASHARFRAKHALPFELLSDPEHRVLEAYGAWTNKTMYGRTFLGIRRSTVVIDGKGVVRRVWPDVKVDGHVDEVLAALRELDAA